MIERTGPDSVNAEILVKMGAMSMTFIGHGRGGRARRGRAPRRPARAAPRRQGGSGYANADVTFTVNDGEGTMHTHAQISGKAASMGEGVVAGVLDALINDFTGKLATL